MTKRSCGSSDETMLEGYEMIEKNLQMEQQE